MLYIFKRSSILDVWLCSEYASEFNCKQSLGWWGTNIPNTHEKSIKNQSVTEWYWCGKYGAMNKKCRCLCCYKIEAMKYFELLDMKYGECSQPDFFFIYFFP